MESHRWRQGGGPFRHSPPQKPRYLTVFVAVPRPECQPPAQLLEGCLRSLSGDRRALWLPTSSPSCRPRLGRMRLLRTPGNLQEKPAARVGGWLQCQRAEKRGRGGTHWLPRGRGTPSPRSRLAVLRRPGDSSRRQAPDTTLQVQVPHEGPVREGGRVQPAAVTGMDTRRPPGVLDSWNLGVCVSTQQQG